MSVPSHMALGPLKALAARLLALPIFVPMPPKSARAEVFRRFCMTVPEAQATANTTLGAFLTRQLAVADGYVLALTPAEQADVRPLLARLRTAVASVACTSCAGPGGHQCASQSAAQDNAQIAHTGLCLSVIRELHEQLLERLQATIAQWGRAEAPGVTQSLSHAWGTAWTGEPAREQPGPEPKASANTAFRDQLSPVTRHSELQLQFVVDELDWSSMLMIPWLITHEFVCHVQQTPPDPNPRKACRPSCAFFEGWMDEVAFRLMQADLGSGWLGAPGPGFLKRHRQEVLNAAQQYRNWRYGWGPGGNSSRLAPQWSLGVQAARAVLDIFEATSPEANESERRKLALRQLLALSFRIQAASPSVNELDHAVDACLRAAAEALDGGPERQARALALITEPIVNMANWINKLRAL